MERTELLALVDRYVAVWNEQDAGRRRAGVAALWAEDGAHLTPALEARGHAAIEARIAAAHERFVRSGFTFAPLDNIDGHHRTVKFGWVMRPADGAAVAAGSDFLMLGDDGRIRFDYQFTEPTPSR